MLAKTSWHNKTRLAKPLKKGSCQAFENGTSNYRQKKVINCKQVIDPNRGKVFLKPPSGSHSNQNYSTYVPDVPGCVATGKTRDEARQNVVEALELHIEGLMEDGLPIPSPKSEADYIVAET